MTVIKNIDLSKRQTNLLRVVCLFWLFTKAITLSTWTGIRELPVVSFFSFLNTVPAAVHILTLIVSSFFLTLYACKPKRLFLIVTLVSELVSVTLDAIRLQPWEYLYLFILFFAVLYYARPVLFFKIIILLFASTYIFSGLHKISGAFLNTIWNDLVLIHMCGMVRVDISPLQHYVGLCIGGVEFLLGILLLFPRYRVWACYGLIGMHLIILLSLGIALHGNNYSVYPWNVLMMYMLYTISQEGFHAEKHKLPNVAKLALFIFWFVLPLSNFFGYWGHYLSSGMYTGKTPKVYICIPEQLTVRLNAQNAIRDSVAFCNGQVCVSITNWVEQQTGVMPFPEYWYYRELKNQISTKYNTNITMYYKQYPELRYREMR